MYIKSIEIDNFKSFANQVTIPFYDGFTTISGPNGSGKSNIIDSVLFALGLSSSRSLRAEKLFHLISTHNKRNEAIVKITFESKEKKELFTVARRIRKASNNNFVSTYYLNEKTATLTEIHEKLSVHNISPNSYNVMMQGDVTGIINTTPNERRKILDEIAGVADFDRRIEQAKKELETVEERVDKSSIILNEIDVRLVQLEEERSHALKYQELKKERTKFESQLSLVKYFDIKTSIERLHESILDANKAKKEQENNLKQLHVQLEEARKNLKEISELVKSKGEDQQIELKKQIEGLKGSIARKKDSINFTDKQAEDNKNAAISAEQNILKLNEKIDDIKLKIDNKNDEIKIVEQNIAQQKEELEKALSQVTSINKTANEHVEKRNNLRKELESKQDNENALIKQKLPLEEKISRAKRDISEAKSFIQRFEDAKNNKISSKDLLQTQVIELERELKDYELVQKNSLYELDKVKNELSDLSYNVSLAYRKVAQLEATKRAAEDANFGRAVDTIMNSDLEGVHAPLAQLGKVDKEYSTALEIAMGGSMRFIVVDDDEVGRVGIEILKSSRAGRATFLPLNKIKPAPRNMRLPNDRGVIDFAINLIDYDPQYDDAFYHAVRDTLIVEDLEAARYLTGKYRMVTLDGSVVERTGSMTGGSVARSGLKFSQSQDEELQVYKQRLEELENKKNNFENKKLTLEQKLDKIRHEYSSTMNEFNRKKIELDNSVKNLDEAEGQIADKQKLIEDLEPQIESYTNELIDIENKITIINEEVKILNSNIQEIENILPKDELAKLNELTEDVEFEIKRNESKLANCQNDIKAFNMEIDFNNNAIQAHKERIEKTTKDNDTLAQEKELFKKEIVTIEEQLVELNEKIKEVSSELVGLQQERDKINAEVLNSEKRRSIAESKIERTAEQIEAYKTRRKELEPELFTLRDELVNAGYELAKITNPEVSVEEVNRNISRLQRRMEDMEPVNMKALVEYDDVLNRKDELKTKIDTLSSERTQIIERMGSYEELKKKSFMDTYENVNENFKSIFERLSDGIGSLVLEKPNDPLNGGLTIEAQPRGKKMQRLESMSGGEKSLTALAFVFAIQRYMPAPFYAFDEVDMHLDGINVEKLADMIKHQAQDTQFIVVSLRKPMIESANRTVGVTQKNSGITKVTGMKFSD